MALNNRKLQIYLSLSEAGEDLLDPETENNEESKPNPTQPTPSPTQPIKTKTNPNKVEQKLFQENTRKDLKKWRLKD